MIQNNTVENCSIVNQAKLVVKYAFTFKVTMTLNHTWDISKNLDHTKVGQDRIEKILTSSQFQALAKGFSIDLKSIQFSSKQTASVAELNRKFLEATAAASINQINNNSDSEVRLFLS